MTTSLQGSRKIKIEDEEQITTQPSLLDYYAYRKRYQGNIPDILELNFIRFLN